MENKETYSVSVRCKNCKWNGTQVIQKGCSVEYLIFRGCPICGCNEMCSIGIPKKSEEIDSKFIKN